MEAREGRRVRRREEPQSPGRPTYESASSALMSLSAPIVFEPVTVVAEGPGSQTPLVVSGTEHVGGTCPGDKTAKSGQTG